MIIVTVMVIIDLIAALRFQNGGFVNPCCYSFSTFSCDRGSYPPSASRLPIVLSCWCQHLGVLEKGTLNQLPIRWSRQRRRGGRRSRGHWRRSNRGCRGGRDQRRGGRCRIQFESFPGLFQVSHGNSTRTLLALLSTLPRHTLLLAVLPRSSLTFLP